MDHQKMTIASIGCRLCDGYRQHAGRSPASSIAFVMAVANTQDDRQRWLSPTFRTVAKRDCRLYADGRQW